ncbi:MAG: PhoU domain-containing protein [bacterium]|jgi:phosphate uptake regulator|nr:PhoU domain-containing protein [bacterium]
MFERLFGDKDIGLLNDAIEEACRMITESEGMFGAACGAMFEGKKSPIDVVERDENIDIGERMVRRLVFQHIMMNPDQDLPSALALVSVVHDAERIGDYNKSLLYLSRWRSANFMQHPQAKNCAELRVIIAPMIGQTLKTIRDGDAAIARIVMAQNLVVKERTHGIQEALLQSAEGRREDVVCSSCAQYLRRISAHLSNIASSVANPFDQLGQNTP